MDQGSSPVHVVINIRGRGTHKKKEQKQSLSVKILGPGLERKVFSFPFRHNKNYTLLLL